ncbi:MAG: rhodanese-related sulfurtransferase [Flavobacteriales bacterium]|nr:rhodanese-related sulfurtransferase [Flavobacteriales bacterium]
MSIKFPFNKLNRSAAEEKIREENFARVTLSFYRYIKINDPKKVRDDLFFIWEAWGVLGRIYIAKEGINAQLCVPEHFLDAFKKHLNNYDAFKNLPFKIAIEEPKVSFYKLTVKVKKQIVADGLKENEYDVTDIGRHLNASEWNKAMADGAIVVDMRNHYESEIGHFENAICPEAETFREELPMVKDILKGKEDEKVLLYCTGGIRCEKASSYLKHFGFNDVNQLHGGIINYSHQVQSNVDLNNKFLGKNFVFDDRLSERISDDVISNCHQCGKPCDYHVNCKNLHCNLLFIQCSDCAKKHSGCCSPSCLDIISLPEEEQKKLRAGAEKRKMYHSHKKVDLRDAFNKKRRD